MTLTFDLLTSKLVHELRVTLTTFTSFLVFLGRFIINMEAGIRQTDSRMQAVMLSVSDNEVQTVNVFGITFKAMISRVKTQTPFIQFVVNLLCICFTACCTTNPQQIAQVEFGL